MKRVLKIDSVKVVSERVFVSYGARVSKIYDRLLASTHADARKQKNQLRCYALKQETIIVTCLTIQNLPVMNCDANEN